MLPAFPLLPEYSSAQLLGCPCCPNCLCSFVLCFLVWFGFFFLPGSLTAGFVAGKDYTLATHFVFLIVVLILVAVTDKSALAS